MVPLGHRLPVHEDVLDDELACQRRDGQIEPLESARGDPEDHAHEGGDESGQGDSKPEGQPKAGRDDGPCIGPNAEEGPVAQRYLAREADKDVQAKGSNGGDTGDVQDIEKIRRAHERDRSEEQGQPDEGPCAAEVGLEDGKLLRVVFLVVPAGVVTQASHRAPLYPLDLHEAEEPVGFDEQDDDQDDVRYHVAERR